MQRVIVLVPEAILQTGTQWNIAPITLHYLEFISPSMHTRDLYATHPHSVALLIAGLPWLAATSFKDQDFFIA